ncbi:MAG: shikimate kinase [Chloroflexaceae bacterium]
MERSLALVGLSGAGKSTLARMLAAYLGWPVADTDALVVAQTGLPVAAIFAGQGEEAFRDLEAGALARALEWGPAVVATGGGVVLRAANRALLRAQAFVVWLDAPDTELVERLRTHDEERPLLAGDALARLAALRAAREPLYARVAHLRLETAGVAPEEATRRIISAYREWDHRNPLVPRV